MSGTREGEPFLVQASLEAKPEPLTRDTVIVLVANQKSAGYTDSTGADVPTFDIVGGGDLYVLHGGELIEGSWFRASQVEGYVFINWGRRRDTYSGRVGLPRDPCPPGN